MTLAYYVNQLENYDPKLYTPLFSATWGRDIQLRAGIVIGNESSSFTRSTYGVIGSQTAQGKPWLSQAGNTLMSVSVNGEKIVHPIRPLGIDITYSSIDIERSKLTGTPLDVQQLDAMSVAYQMWTDEMVYIGDQDTANPSYGLLNSPEVTTTNVVAGVSSFTEWSQKTPQEKLFDVNTLSRQSWNATGNSQTPTKLLLPPEQFSLIAQEIVSSAGSISTLKFLRQNSLCLENNNSELDIQPVKWLAGAGVGGTDRMIAYTNRSDFVRFPMAPIRRETAYTQSIYYHAPYIWAYGVVEIVYPETIIYADGI